MTTKLTFATLALSLAAMACGDDSAPADGGDTCDTIDCGVADSGTDLGASDGGAADLGGADGGAADLGGSDLGEELCVGDDATGDTDGDGVCDDLDVCAGDDARGDADEDGVCDDLDACAGDDATGDTDGDGVCDDEDACAGDDATGDTDGDGVCDDEDACAGQDDAILSEPVLPPFDLDIYAVELDPAAVGENTVRAFLSNGGNNSLNGQTFTLQYSFDGGSSWTVTESFTGSTLGSTCDTQTVEFSAPLDVSGAAPVELCARVSPQVTGDPDPGDVHCTTVPF